MCEDKVLCKLYGESICTDQTYFQWRQNNCPKYCGTCVTGTSSTDSSPTRVKPCCVLEQGTFTPQKVLVIPRKRWLRPNITEKLLTGTLRIIQPTKQRQVHIHVPNHGQMCYTICGNNNCANLHHQLIVAVWII